MPKATSAFAPSALEGGQERIQAVHALQIRGPLTVTGMSDSASRKKIFICQARRTTADETACARKIVSNFARRAFRRPVTDEDVNPLMAFYKSGLCERRLRTRRARCASGDPGEPAFSVSRGIGRRGRRDPHAERSGVGFASFVLPVEQHAG